MCYIKYHSNIAIINFKHIVKKEVSNIGRPTTKADLMTAATDNYKKLNTLISRLTEKELSTTFDFSGDEKKERSTLETR